MKKTLRDFS